MSRASIVFIGDPGGHAPAVDGLLHRLPATVVIDGSASASRICADINEADPAPPIVIVAEGRAVLALPAVARSQRAMHRLVLQYLLIDPELPPVTDAWPDARIAVACDVDSEASLQARLRGWDVLRVEDLEDWGPD